MFGYFIASFAVTMFWSISCGMVWNGLVITCCKQQASGPFYAKVATMPGPGLHHIEEALWTALALRRQAGEGPKPKKGNSWWQVGEGS